MDRGTLGKRKTLENVNPRAAQAGSPIALLLFDQLADPSSTLRGLLRVSDLFCVRLTCKEAWRCIQHRPLSKLGVLKAAHDRRCLDHHVPLLRWCLRNDTSEFFRREWPLETVGQAGDVELVSELLRIEPKSERVTVKVLRGAAEAGHDELTLQLLAEFMEVRGDKSRENGFKRSVAVGGCVRTAAAIDDDPTAWVDFVSLAMRNGHRRFVEWVLADVEPDADARYVADAAQSGSLELVKWLYAKGYTVGEDAMTNAAESGNVDLCKWVSDHGLVPAQNAMKAAVRGGHVQVLEWLSNIGCICTSELLRHAVRAAGVPVVAWCLDHHPHPPDAGDLLVHSCTSLKGCDVFEYLADQRCFHSSPKELMQAAAERKMWKSREAFDAAILVKRYGIPLYSDYMFDSIDRDDLGRLRFALSQGQEVSAKCYETLIVNADTTLLNEVLVARKVGDSVPEADQTLIKQALRGFKCREYVTKVLADHSIVACNGECDCCGGPDEE